MPLDLAVTEDGLSPPKGWHGRLGEWWFAVRAMDGCEVDREVN
jgi:hypothetical protein